MCMLPPWAGYRIDVSQGAINWESTLSFARRNPLASPARSTHNNTVYMWGLVQLNVGRGESIEVLFKKLQRHKGKEGHDCTHYSRLCSSLKGSLAYVLYHVRAIILIIRPPFMIKRTRLKDVGFGRKCGYCLGGCKFYATSYLFLDFKRLESLGGRCFLKKQTSGTKGRYDLC